MSGVSYGSSETEVSSPFGAAEIACLEAISLTGLCDDPVSQRLGHCGGSADELSSQSLWGSARGSKEAS